MDFRKELQSRILIGEGAMGTLLYSTGMDQCYEELNLKDPVLVQNIHEAYTHAGADILQSNTYGANHFKLQRYGLEDQVAAINREGIKIAKKAAKNHQFVFGTIGASRSHRKSDLTIDVIKRNFREQFTATLINQALACSSSRNSGAFFI